MRLDTVPPNGGRPGSDPDLAREQLLDEYGLTAAILNNISVGSGGNIPVGLATSLARATNEYDELWLESDERWRSSINVSMVDPKTDVAEIIRCRDANPRFVQVMLGTHNERPAGNPIYWPIYEAAADLGIPVAFHVMARAKHHPQTGVGQTSFYYELRTSLDVYAQSLVSSLIFEGVFDRWPSLKIALIETDWTWVVPMAWRLDATWRVMREEVPELERLPSEYLREHCWFSTQPGVETEFPGQIYEVYEQFERSGFGAKLMFATDYPHWDMDSPFEAVPPKLSDHAKRSVLGGNAAALYGIELPPAASS